jgi:hypothetical protein
MPMPKISGRMTEVAELPDLSILDILDTAWRRRSEWRLQYLWWPRRCHISGRLMWLEMAYKGVLIGYGYDGNLSYDTRYHSTVEHLIWLLKK